MSLNVTAAEQQMLQTIRTKADELARLVNEAAQAGFTINYQINGAIGACDVFNVFRMVPVDLKGAAN